MKWVHGVVLFFLTHEALQWSWSLARHSSWMNKHPQFINCKNINHRMTSLAAIMAGCLSFMVGVWFIVYGIDDNEHFFDYAFVICGIQLSHIHFMALLARCTELPMELWPLLSRCVARCVVAKFKKSSDKCMFSKS